MTERRRAPSSKRPVPDRLARNLSRPPNAAPSTATIPRRSSTTGVALRADSGKAHSEKRISSLFVPPLNTIASPGLRDRITRGKVKASDRIPEGLPPFQVARTKIGPTRILQGRSISTKYPPLRGKSRPRRIETRPSRMRSSSPAPLYPAASPRPRASSAAAAIRDEKRAFPSSSPAARMMDLDATARGARQKQAARHRKEPRLVLRRYEGQSLGGGRQCFFVHRRFEGSPRQARSPSGEARVQERKEADAYSIPEVFPRRIGGIPGVGDSFPLQVRKQIGLPYSEEGPQERPRCLGYAYEASGARPAEEAHEDRFDLVVHGVSQENGLGPAFRHRRTECGIAKTPGRGFDSLVLRFGPFEHGSPAQVRDDETGSQRGAGPSDEGHFLFQFPAFP